MKEVVSLELTRKIKVHDDDNTKKNDYKTSSKDTLDGLSNIDVSKRWIEAINKGLIYASRGRTFRLSRSAFRRDLPLLLVAFLLIIIGASRIRNRYDTETILVGCIVIFMCIFNVILEYRRFYLEKTYVPSLLRRYLHDREENDEIVDSKCTSYESSFIACYREGVWVWISPSVLVCGDVVALKTNQIQTCSFASSLRKLHVKKSSRETRYERYVLTETPALNIIKSLQDKKNLSSTHFRRQLESLFFYQFIFAIFSIVLAYVISIIRWFVEDDANELNRWEEVFLIRPICVTLVSFLLPLPFLIVLIESICASSLLCNLDPKKYSYVFMETLRRVISLFRSSSSESIQLPFTQRPLDAIDRIGSVTAMCCVDADVVCESEPLIEEICVEKEDTNGRLILDLHRDEKSRIRFEDTEWNRHLASLKPLGLCCLLNAQLTIRNVNMSNSSLKSSGDMREFILRML